MKRKLISVVGVRPEFIKLSGLLDYLNKYHHLVVHTGQHFDKELSENIFKELSLKKTDYHLTYSKKNRNIGTMIMKCTTVLQKEKPDAVLVYGDSFSTLVGSIASVRSKIPLIHIESGLRSFDPTMPEETNRIIVDHLSNLHLSPSKVSFINLEKEGIRNSVFITGDINYITFLKMKPTASILEKMRIRKYQFYYFTLHRSENTTSFTFINSILKVFGNFEKKVIFPVHPRISKEIAVSSIPSNVIVIKPVSYSESLGLQRYAHAVITDSGGIQKEAYWLKVPCFTLRKSTEWVETVESGWNHLINPSSLKKVPDMVNKFTKAKAHPNFYGSRSTGKKMIWLIETFLGGINNEKS